MRKMQQLGKQDARNAVVAQIHLQLTSVAKRTRA